MLIFTFSLDQVKIAAVKRAFHRRLEEEFDDTGYFGAPHTGPRIS